ncbi:hypothetical protein [Micromonospora sp. WMMD980]|uniref:hypothetical protein n=1 Tax=Micromonospora sp. WMMD980 TaxID=3016088 RepID=UPI002417DC90|nr:hypothetical protein [Micromonospora sp. WMMD980]MDG4802629.1 hypothetical protein [Micromonospora sp. WMMD980]
MRVGEQSRDPIDQILGDVPVPATLTPEDVRLAVRAVVVHAAEEWPAGPKCRNDGAAFPCRLHRWGRRVLETHGLNERQIDALVRHGNPFVHVPFPFVLSGPSTARPGAAPRPGSAQPVRPGSTARLAPGQVPRGPVPRVTAPPVRPGVGRPTRATGSSTPPAPVARPRWPRAS